MVNETLASLSRLQLLTNFDSNLIADPKVKALIPVFSALAIKGAS